MPETIDIKADDEIDTLTTLIEAKTGNHVLPAEAIREAVAYWLDSHEVAECDGDESNTRSIVPKPDVAIRNGEIAVDGPSPLADSDEYPFERDDGTIPKR